MIAFDSAPPPEAPDPPRKIFRMAPHDRMAGSVPVWDYERTAKETVAGEIATAANQSGAPAIGLAYRAESGHPGGSLPREFGFGDILDIVNPLHHVPVVGTIYRHVTGDEIQPASRIVGGAIFGGGPGAASGLVNLIAEEETGRDIPGNVLALARGEPVELKNKATAAYEKTHRWQERYNS